MEQKSDANLDPIIYVHDDAEEGDKVFDNGFDQFFVNVGGRHGIDNNSDEEQCPIIKCELKAKDCKATWNGGDGNNIEMAATAPWAITIKDNTFAGYGPDEMCVVCDNEYQIIQFDQLKITQTGRCIDKLDTKALVVPNLPLKWDGAVDATTFAAGWSSYMTNTDTDATMCKPTNCEARKADC